jgi:hypothetical protein
LNFEVKDVEEVVAVVVDEDLDAWGDPKPPVQTGNASARIVATRNHIPLENPASRRSALSAVRR